MSIMWRSKTINARSPPLREHVSPHQIRNKKNTQEKEGCHFYSTQAIIRAFLTDASVTPKPVFHFVNMTHVANGSKQKPDTMSHARVSIINSLLDAGHWAYGMSLWAYGEI